MDVFGSQGATLTVVIAAYNAEALLPRQLEALCAQAPASCDWSVLVCDNGSSDRTAEVARSFADRLPIEVLDAAGRRGPSYARNFGVMHSRSRYVAFCDADDVVASDWVATMADLLSQHPFVAGSFEANRLNTQAALKSRTVPQQSQAQESPFEDHLPHAGAGNMGLHREVFLAVGGFDESMLACEDTDLSWRLQQRGIPLHFAPELVIHVRLRHTLRGMFHQARGYGSAEYHLTRQHRAESPAVGADDTAQNGAAKRRTVGALVWFAGWYLGFHWPQSWARHVVGTGSLLTVSNIS